MSPVNQPKMTKAERTAEAREKARLIREAQLKADKRKKLAIGWGIVGGVIAILTIIAIVIVGGMNGAAKAIGDEGPTPANANAHGGITLLTGSEIKKSESTTVKLADLPAAPETKPATPTVPDAVSKEGEPVKVVAYIDFICPACKSFETNNGEMLNSLRNEGKIQLEYRPIGFLDFQSTTNYSSRAANAAACVVNESPEKYADFHELLFEKQPAEGGAGISDDDLKKMATEVGAKSIDQCIEDKTYRPFVKVATESAQIAGISGTPSVFVEGKQWGVGATARTPLEQVIQEAIEAK